MRKVLVPLDGSALAASAIPVVERLADPGDALFLITADEAAPPPRSSTEQAATLARLQAALEPYRERLAAKGFKCETAARAGVGAILDYAHEIGADTIVMTSHGKSALRRILYGSVALRLLSHFEGEIIMICPAQSAFAGSHPAGSRSVPR